MVLSRYDIKVQFSEHIIEDSVGQLICTDVPLARDGDYTYSSHEVFGDGKFHAVTVHRDWEEVRKLKPQLEGKPFIVTHINGEDLNINNLKDHKVGHGQNIREDKMLFEGREYNVLIGDIVIDDPEVIESVKSGELRGISLGYFYDVDDSDKNYIRQINMRAEHIALVPEGRAGLSKILDSVGGYILAELKNDNIGLVHYTLQENRNTQSVYRDLSEGAYVITSAINPEYVSVDDGAIIPQKIINEIVSYNSDKDFIAFDESGAPMKVYINGSETDITKMKKSIRNITLGRFSDGYSSDYEIPGDREAIEREQKEQIQTEKEFMLLYHELTPLFIQVNKDLDRNDKNVAWQQAVKLLKNNAHLLDKLPRDLYDEEWLNVMREVYNIGKTLSKKAHDETYVPLLVITYDAEGSDIEYVAGLEEVYRVMKKKKIELLEVRDDDVVASPEETIKSEKQIEVTWELEEELRYINKHEGVFVLEVEPDEDMRLLVAEVEPDGDISISVYDTVSEANQGLNEYFNSFDAAYMTINTKLGKYRKMSAIII